MLNTLVILPFSQVLFGPGTRLNQILDFLSADSRRIEMMLRNATFGRVSGVTDGVNFDGVLVGARRKGEAGRNYIHLRNGRIIQLSCRAAGGRSDRIKDFVQFRGGGSRVGVSFTISIACTIAGIASLRELIVCSSAVYVRLQRRHFCSVFPFG